MRYNCRLYHTTEIVATNTHAYVSTLISHVGKRKHYRIRKQVGSFVTKSTKKIFESSIRTQIFVHSKYFDSQQ